MIGGGSALVSVMQDRRAGWLVWQLSDVGHNKIGI